MFRDRFKKSKKQMKKQKNGMQNSMQKPAYSAGSFFLQFLYFPVFTR